MSGKILYYISEAAPFEPGEEFLNDEFPLWLKTFDRIVIIHHSLKPPSTNFPSHVELHYFPYLPSGKEKLSSLRYFFSAKCWRELKEMIVHYRLFPSPGRMASMFGGMAVGSKLARFIEGLQKKNSGLDVYAYSYWSNFMAIGLAILKQRHTNWICVTRSHGYDLYFERSPIGYLPFRRFLYCTLDHVFFISKMGLDYATKKSGHFPSMTLSYLGIAPIEAETKSQSTSSTPFTIVSCSTIIPLKRVHLIAQALALVKPIRPVRWVHFGAGPLMEDVRSLSMSLLGNQEGKEFELKGQVTNQKVLRFYSKEIVHLFINLSDSEGLPFSIIEAFAAGIPAIATNVGGVSEIVRDGFNGKLLPCDINAQLVADEISKKLTLPTEAWSVLSRNAHATWSESFQAEKNFKAFLEVFVRSTP